MIMRLPSPTGLKMLKTFPNHKIPIRTRGEDFQYNTISKSSLEDQFIFVQSPKSDGIWCSIMKWWTKRSLTYRMDALLTTIRELEQRLKNA